MSLEPLTPEQQDRILTEIGYNRAQLHSDICNLRKWIEQQKHLPQCSLKETDIFLSNFLVGCKGSIERAKKKLDYYYSLRGKGDVFTERGNPQYIDKLYDFDSVVVLPQNDTDGSRIYLAKMKKIDVEGFDPLLYFKTAIMVMEYRLRNDGILGRETYVIDSAYLSLSHVLKVSPTSFRSFLSFFTEAYPLRVKKIIVANAPPAVATAMNNLFLPFASKKIKERYFISKEPVEKIVDFVKLLPEDYDGGKGRGIAQLADEWKANLKKAQLELASQLEEEVDESKRPTIDGSTDSMFGLHGSIKTLVID